MSMPLALVDIVDDNVEALRSLGRVLSAHGYRICMFKSAEQYLKTVEEGKASCVVIGVDLHGSIPGLDLGRAILACRRAIPVIFIARSADAALKEQALSMGCIAYLEEPVSSESLIAAIKSSGTPSSRLPPPGPGR